MFLVVLNFLKHVFKEFATIWKISFLWCLTLFLNLSKRKNLCKIYVTKKSCLLEVTVVTWKWLNCHFSLRPDSSQHFFMSRSFNLYFIQSLVLYNRFLILPKNQWCFIYTLALTTAMCILLLNYRIVKRRFWYKQWCIRFRFKETETELKFLRLFSIPFPIPFQLIKRKYTL